jgi:murein DD-endopeptidase MepM/ murein hydrolase activator NlpD
VTSHRTTARGALFLTLALAAAACAASAWATNDPPRKASAASKFVFPVVGPVTYYDDFGEPRGLGRHEGNDIVADRKAPAVAAEGGTVTFWTTSRAAGCMLYLHGDSGTTYLYIHLNNDLTKANDNRGSCRPGISYAKGLRDGARVEAGQQIGYVGDSGDADGAHPHLHFEVHPHDGRAVDPYGFLKRAQPLLFAAPLGSTFTLTLEGTVVSASGGVLRLVVDTLRRQPGGLLLRKLDRSLLLSVPLDAVVERQPAGTAALTSARPGERVSVWTAPAAATLPMLTGADAALAASRVLFRTA